jgi:pyridoxamine 5'-phosphate oxidase
MDGLYRDNRKIENDGPAARSAAEDAALEALEQAVRDGERAGSLEAIAGQLTERLAGDPSATMAWEALPAGFFGDGLPADVASSWIFVLRPGVDTGPERHPNSRQRTASFRGRGDLRVSRGGRWESHVLSAEATAPLERRWVSIPASTWHRVVVGPEPWAVVSFHTAPAEELIEERPADEEDLERAKPAILRRRYLAAGAADPIGEIRRERERARRAGEENADVCYLVTVGRDGIPQARAMTLRDVTGRGFGVIANRTSRKWHETRGGPVTLLLHWPAIGRQFRVTGRAEETMPREEIERAWRAKSRGSRLLEHFYTADRPQSAALASRRELEDGIAAVARRYPDDDAVPIPDSLAGLVIVPETIESWLASPADRLHDRRLFRRDGGGWTAALLVP